MSPKAISLLKRTCGAPMLTPLRVPNGKELSKIDKSDIRAVEWDPRPPEYIASYFGAKEEEWPEVSATHNSQQAKF